jgi:hypothetical protein
MRSEPAGDELLLEARAAFARADWQAAKDLYASGDLGSSPHRSDFVSRCSPRPRLELERLTGAPLLGGPQHKRRGDTILNRHANRLVERDLAR